MHIDIRNSTFFAGPSSQTEERRLAAIEAVASASEAHAEVLQELARKLGAPNGSTGLVIHGPHAPARPWSGEGFYPAQQASVQPESEEASDD